MDNASCRSRPYGSESRTEAPMRARWSTDGGPASAQRTAVDSGPCAAGRTGSIMLDAWVTPMSTRCTGRANGRAAASKVFKSASDGPCRPTESDVGGGAGGGGVELHRVAEHPHQWQAASAIARDGGRRLPRSVIGDAGAHFAVGEADFERHGPGGESTV